MYPENYYPRPKKKSSKGLAAFFLLLNLSIVVFSLCLFIEMDKNHNDEIAVLKNQAAEYESEIDGYNSRMDEILAQLANMADENKSASEGLNSLSSQLDSLSDDTSVLQTASSNFNISETADKVSPSVIGIDVYVPAQNTGSFWASSPMNMQGSGIILSEDGYIVTNYHVISYAVTYKNAIITVILSGGEEYSAEIVGGDEINDLAVIKVDAEGLPPATLGSSSESKVGDFVIAIGNPLGTQLYGSVTFGIISGLNRKMETENVAEELLQTDAAINPGNSGGALINAKGEVIGINTIKIATEEVEGLGFAIPIDYAKPMIESIIAYGYVKDRPTLGIDGSDISRNVALFYNVPQGVLVSGYINSSYASDLKANDIITAINGTAVTTLSEINKLVKTLKVGETVTVKIWRDGETMAVEVVLFEKR